MNIFLYILGWIIAFILFLIVKNNIHLVGDEDYPTSIWMLILTLVAIDFIIIIVLIALIII